MKKYHFLSCITISIVLNSLYNNFTSAQPILEDATLSTQIQTNDRINFVINGGTQVGNNLFHSFERLSVPPNGSINFKILSNTRNVFSRVSGKSRSIINGSINTQIANSNNIQGSANFFLMNPNGIVFNSGARLNVGGSFLGTTANSIGFSNGKFFGVNNNLGLSSGTPISLRFQVNSGDIINKASGTGLEVSPGKTLALIGGNVLLEGRGEEGTRRDRSIIARDGHVVIAAINSGDVSIHSASDSWSFAFGDVKGYKDITQTRGAVIDTSGPRSGSVQFQANNIHISDLRTRVVSVNRGQRAGKPLNFIAKGSFQLLNNAEIATLTVPTLDSSSGDVYVNASNIFLDNSARIRTSTSSTGNAGNIHLFSRNSLELSKNSFISAQTLNPSLNSGNGGLITVNTSGIILRDGGRIINSTDGAGDAGNIDIQTKFIQISGRSNDLSRRPSGFFSQTNGQRATGAAGIININTNSLTIDKGGSISVGSTEEKFRRGRIGFSQGQGGTINIVAEDFVRLSGFGIDVDDSIAPSSIFSGTVGKGNAGAVSINTDRLFVLDGAQISSATIAEGKGGLININAKGDVFLSGVNSGLFASTSGDGAGGDIIVATGRFNLQNNAVVDVRTLQNGPGGNILLKANSFSATRGGQLLSTTSGSQTAGNIKLDVIDSISFDGAGTGVFATTTQNSTGTGGNIDIDPRIVLVLNGAEITASSFGEGPAGNVKLQTGNLTLDGGKILATSTSGQGGDLDLDIDNFLFLTNGSQISATAGNQNTNGDGGNVTINTKLLVALNDSDITANAFTGKGGNIQITTRGLFQSPDSNITASSENGINGQVNINNPEIDPSESLSELPESVEPPQEIAKGCRPGQTLGDSNFVHVGRGGLPPGPHEAQTPSTVWKDLRAHNLQPSYATATDTLPTFLTSKVGPDIIEAKGWTKDSQGRIYLTANTPQPTQSPQPLATC